MSKKRYRLYIDESGDHTYRKLEEFGRRYLGLTGVIIETEYYRETFHSQFEVLKQRHFPHSPDEPLVLHREDIINRRGPFSKLLDEDKKEAFNREFLKLLVESDYRLVSVCIDRKSHLEKHGDSAFHPYHYCLAAILERYAGFLNFYNATGDVMAESRGGKEDVQLKNAYTAVSESGTLNRKAAFFQGALSSKELKLKPKTLNIAGLQLADLLAHPCKSEILIDRGLIEESKEIFRVQISECVADKYNRQVYKNRVESYGKVFLE